MAEALAAVAGPLGAAALRLPSERLQLRAVLSALSGDLGAASELLREGLRLNPDDWGALLLLLDCMLPPAPAQGSGASAGTQRWAAGIVGGASKRRKGVARRTPECLGDRQDLFAVWYARTPFIVKGCCAAEGVSHRPWHCRTC